MLRGTHFDAPDQDGMQPGLSGSSIVLAVNEARLVGQKTHVHIVGKQTRSEAQAMQDR
jgi:hypothetical protein